MLVAIIVSYLLTHMLNLFLTFWEVISFETLVEVLCRQFYTYASDMVR